MNKSNQMNPTHSAILRKCFLELQTEIRVLAVAHAKRHPDYWLNRLQAT